ncbi:TonB-dependent siderophore receptor [Salinisphaera sp. USBA-960]|uniref:TonB-dependent siderophore receptor n=1 Tax=Salinisphaera orenii TaxID=856731 RepID=UPI0013A6616D|nr:TonB-dependent siderophore receptor [Salifodinibacter halophilus]NNC25623.1 TonB-dependent siderophore receptor [Salifodinibacter halophilus]
MKKQGILGQIRPPRAALWLCGLTALATFGPASAATQSNQPTNQQAGSTQSTDGAVAADSDSVAVTSSSQQLQPINVTGKAPGAAAATPGYKAHSSRGATRTDTPLVETPQSVDVVTRQQLTDQDARSVNDALKYTAGTFTGLAGASQRQDVVALRGFHAGDVNNTFFDGLRLMSDPGTYASFQIDPFFLKRVNVVKGPSSVLYGRAMPGGLVNFSSKKPLDTTQREIRFFGGSFHTFGGGIDFTGPLPHQGSLPDDDWGSYRVVGKASTTNTQFDVVQSESYTLMPEVRLNLSDDTKLLLQAYIQHDPTGGFHGSVPYDLSVHGSRFGRKVDPSWVDQSRGNNQFERDEQLFSYKLDHQVNDHVSLHSQSRYSHNETDLKQIAQGGFTGDGATLSRFYSGAHNNLNAFSTDNYAAFDFDTGPVEHKVLTGFGYQQRDNDARNYSASATELDPFNPDYSGDGLPAGVTPVATTKKDRKLRQFGVYVQDQMTWNRWHLLLNGREDYLYREYNSKMGGASPDRSDDNFSGRAAILYQSKWGVSPYFSYSESFNPNAYSPAGGSIPDPTKSHQYELGVKYEPSNMDALFTLALYDLTQKNVQKRTSVAPIKYLGVGDVESKGVEFTAKADLTDNLHVTASYSYNNVEYQDDIATGGVNIQSGNTPTLSPDQLASLWVKYDFPKGISAGLGGRYVGESYANTSNTLKVPDYGLMDGFVGVELGAFSRTLEGLSVRLNGKNLLGRDYVTGCFNENYCYYGEKRQVTATVDYKF